MGRFARARIRIEYILFRVVAGLIGALPLDFASAVSGRIWRFLAPWLPRQQRAHEGLALAFPELSFAERERILSAMWDNLGRTFAEFFHLPQILAEERVTFEEPEKFAAIISHGPFIVCSLHLGNWELAGVAGLRLKLPMAGVYQALTNPLVDRWTYEKRRPFFPGGLFDKSPATSRALIWLARAGEATCFLHRRLARGARRRCALLRPPGSLEPPFPLLLARASGLPLYAVRVKRVGGAHFSMNIEPVAVPVSDDRDADVLAATAALQARFEEFIRETPEQWMWSHRRWAHQGDIVKVYRRR